MRFGMGSALCAGVLALAWAGVASAEEDPLPPVAARPTSGTPSLLSARTLGEGQVMAAGGAGWPSLWVQLELAPTSTFNIGIRASLLYGSPVMALQPGVGAELAVPTRIHLFGEENIDIAVFVTPAITLGEAALVGEGPYVFAGSFGWSTRLEAGGLMSFQVLERLTVFFGVGGHVGFAHTPDAGGPEPFGAAFARLGIEGMISGDTMLFGQLDGGIGIGTSRGGQPLFGEAVPPLLRVALGAAYLF